MDEAEKNRAVAARLAANRERALDNELAEVNRLAAARAARTLKGKAEGE
jgi:hypothetical protein